MSDLINRLEKVKKDREECNSRIIALEARAKKEEEILKEIIKEIKDLGFDPKTLKNDIEKMEKEIEQKLLEKEKDILSTKTALEDIERNVRSQEGF